MLDDYVAQIGRIILEQMRFSGCSFNCALLKHWHTSARRFTQFSKSLKNTIMAFKYSSNVCYYSSFITFSISRSNVPGTEIKTKSWTLQCYSLPHVIEG